MSVFIAVFALAMLVQHCRARHKLRGIVIAIDKLIAQCQAGSNRPTNYARTSWQYNQAPRNVGEVQP